MGNRLVIGVAYHADLFASAHSEAEVIRSGNSGVSGVSGFSGNDPLKPLSPDRCYCLSFSSSFARARSNAARSCEVRLFRPCFAILSSKWSISTLPVRQLR